MNTADQQHSIALQNALLALDPSGPDGFEGLLGIILGELTGQSFRLAKSGTQRGRDGDSAFDGGSTYFEGKRYKDGLSKNDISVKLFDFANDDAGFVDLWILGATCEVASQTVDDARKFAANLGFGITILDWSNNDLGSLLVTTVASSSKSKAFITQGLAGRPGAGLIASALVAIDHFAKHVDYPSRLSSLREALAEDVGLGHAKTLNQSWLSQLFSNKIQVRAEFGQPLCPLDPSGPSVIDRPERSRLTNAFSGVPESELYAIVGEEGVGKSWLAVQSWYYSSPQSLLVICPAEELTGDGAKDFDDFLIRKLIHQTGVNITPQAITRWQRRFSAWRANIPASSVRITLIADGLNQSLKSDWGRWLDRAALHLQSLGGCLVITTRTQHWGYIKNTLSSNIKTIALAEWSIADVKQILGSHDIDFSNTRIEVLESIRNPRLLGIAVELIKAKTIELLDELNIGRLLFEHMRRTQQNGVTPISAPVFAGILKHLAVTILDRLKAQDTDDLRLFDVVDESQLEAVASSQFFSSVKGSSSQYEIKPAGLNLALALYLVGQLEREKRNGRDPRDKLATILEPISALDETAKVVLSATQIACLNEETDPEIQSALIEMFVTLQNLPNSQVNVFAVLAKTAPRAFLQAAENLYLLQEHTAINEWLLYALHNRRDQPGVWQQILVWTQRWLSFYSLAPERQMQRTSRLDSASEVDEERSRVLTVIQERMAALTEVEKSFMTTNLVTAPHPRFDSLSLFALYLLAGMPLKLVAPYLVRWRFAYALNPCFSTSYSEFEQVFRYNRVDWQETRSALIKELETLPEDGSSNVGRWTRVGILYGTGDVMDAQEGERIFDELTRDRERFEGWSLVENYCAVDPCDPGAATPGNVIETAQNYKQIDQKTIATGRGMSQQDHFFRSARTGVARFVPDNALYAHRTLAREVLGRDGYTRHQGVFELVRHSAALTKDLALSFLSAGISSTASSKDENDSKDVFITAQYSTLIALPHLTADEQLDAVANMQGDTILIELLDCLRKTTPEKVEQVLERVLLSDNVHSQTAVLAAIRYSQSPLTPRAAVIVKGLINSPIKSLRHEAHAVAASSGDTSLLQEVVDSGWRARKPRGRDSGFEDWHGSSALLKACQAGLIEAEHALDRMNLSHYGFAAQTLPVETISVIATHVEAAIRKALDYQCDIEFPDIEIGISNVSNSTPPLPSLKERVPSNNDLASQMNRFSETDEQLNERHRRLVDSYERFATELTSADADLILADLTFDGIKAIIGQDAGRAQHWVNMLLSTSDHNLRYLHHVALPVAIMFSVTGNPLAQTLITRVLTLDPPIRRVSGAAKIPVETITLWNNTTSPMMLDICKKCLQTARTDSDIAHEVFAAHLCGKVAILETFIDELLAMGRPYETALALMITGYCDKSDHADAVLSRYNGAKGFIGKVHTVASDSYARNVWAKYWYAEMLNAQQPGDFWQASILFMKIVDGRFDIWAEVSGEPSAIFTAFMPTIERAICNRADKIQKKRKEKLFGDKAPASIILSAK